ncbi:sulfate permease, SulP family [Bradyrhizobium sp. cf659]|nr:sulfate permease, SulP family [Bradyrhizobium sp. cf659]
MPSPPVIASKAHRQGIRLFITGASPAVRRALLTHGVTPPRARYRETIARAVADIKGGAAKRAAASDGAAAH